MPAIQRLSAWTMRALREHRVPLLILIGLTLRPRHAWLLWLGSVVIEWIAVGLMGKYDDAGGGETVASIMIEAFGWMVFGVLIPVGLGRLIRIELIDAGRRTGRPSRRENRGG